jgi:hypothetical protein
MSADRHGKGKKRRRGVHKNHGSPETGVWNREHLIPERPVWMDAATYHALASLRTELQAVEASAA